MSLPRIYTATYSGVAVFEMVVNDIAIMRRQVDSHMNATQILKVAGIEKGKRTKILEREILPGEHEKVQGGYGKFQGTWIPLARSIDLAKQYQVYELVKPMMEFDPTTCGTIDEKRQVLTKEQAQLYDRQAQTNKRKRKHVPSVSGTMLAQHQQQANVQPRQYQPQQQQHYDQNQNHHQPWKSDNEEHPYPLQKRHHPTSSNEPTHVPPNDNPAYAKHTTLLMSIFLSDDSGNITELFKTSKDIDVNLALDEQGNSALHWAASLGRSNTAEQLITHGADINRQNYAGETALMRSVAATNNFDRDCFRRLLKLLEGSIPMVDHKHRNIIHHTAITAGIHGREMAALYYMHHLLNQLDKPLSSGQTKSTLLDAQDDQGDTAINIAARLDCSKMTDLLSEAGANKSTENNLGLTPNDYIAGDVKSPDNATSKDDTNSTFLHVPPPSNTTLHPTLYSKRPTSSAQRGKEIVATVQKIVDSLDEEYGDQLSTRETELKDMKQKQEETNATLAGARKDLEKRQEQSQHLAEAQQKVRQLNQALENGWTELNTLLRTDKATLDRKDVLQLDVDQDIDAAFAVTKEEGRTTTNARLAVMKLRARVDAYVLNNDALKVYADGLRAETAEKEIQCKRLIAACCNLPMDKIDELVEPLTMAIESDPPDLDLARVIGFMEKIRRQGTFPEAPGPAAPAAALSANPSDISLKVTSPSSQTSHDRSDGNQNTTLDNHIRSSSRPPETNSP